MVLQVNPSAAVEWTRPLDWCFDPDRPKRALGTTYGQIMFVVADGSTHQFSQDISDRDLNALITRNGGEEIDLDKL